MMRALATGILILVVSICSFGQTESQFNGLLTIGGVNSSGSHDYQIDGIFNNLTGAYPKDSMKVGHVIWDNKCDRYRIDSIEFIVPNIRVHVTDLNSVEPSTGMGLVMDPTINEDYPIITSGLPEDLLACIETHRAILIDQDVGGVGQQDIQRVDDSLNLSGSSVKVSVKDDDADPANEIQTIAKVDSLVTLSDGGGTFVDEVDDADNDPNNEIELPSGGTNGQKLASDGAGGHYWGDDMVDDLDSDPTNEFDVTTESDNAPTSPKQGDVWVDTDDSETKKYDGSSWILLGSTGIQILGDYKNDSDAASNGVPINGYYRLIQQNTLGRGAGDIRQRKY